MKKFRILGYYHFPNQDMKPEEDRIQEAIHLAPLLEKSLQSIYQNPETDTLIREMISSPTVFIFKDEDNQLYGFFTGNKTVRISNVIYNKSAIKQVTLKYKAWFYPGKSINLIKVNENHINNNQTNNISQNNNMGTKTAIPAPEVNSKAYERVFDKMYITNVEKRLRELNSPSEIDKKRWVWELIQNAKDTIAKDPNKNSINIRIEISKGENNVDIVRFRHDGSPFTPDARLGLLYKYSEDKENQESTGRFGTGFLTTHCLSKIVTIESNMFSDTTCTKLCGFTVTMYRDGIIASELIDGLRKMRESEVFFEETFDWTTFTYHVTSESGRQAIKLGVENFRENIAQTMLFCKELASIVLDDNGKITTIVRKPTAFLTNDIMLSEFDITGEVNLTRRFIHTSYCEHNEYLSERYRANRNMRLDTAVEVDTDNNIVDIEDKTSFFCVMPLVGIETQLNEPLIINSPDFEPDQERQSLLLSGIIWNEEKNVITENGINRAIYEHVFPLYTKLVKYLTDNQFGKLYYLANGLNRIKKHEKLDHEWYKPNVINKYREILMQYPIAEAQDNSGYLKLNDCIIVKEAVQENEDKVFNLLKSVYPSKLIRNNHEWSNYLWKEGLSIWNTESLCSEIEQKTNWTNISLTGINLTFWYNEFLGHVLKYNELFLKEYALLPNMNGELLKKDQENFKQGEHVNSFVINLLKSLGKDVKPLLLHEDITSISLDSKYNSQSYSADVNRLAKAIIDDNNELHKVSKLLPLISVVPNNSEKYKHEFLKQRNEFFNICKALHQLTEAISVCDNNLLEGAWKETDEWLITNILSSLKSLGCLSNLPRGLDAKWLNASLKSLHVQTEKFNSYAVLPNQIGTFCCQKDLYEDAGIPEELKDGILDNIGINYKNILLHEDIDAADFSIIQKKTISTFANELNDAIASMTQSSWGNYFNGSYHKYPKETIYKVASYMIRLLPKNKESNLYKYQSSLLSIAQSFNITEGIVGYIDFENNSLWNKISFYAACIIWEKIEEFNTLAELCSFVNMGESDVICILNSYYAYQNYADIKFDSDNVIPNQNGNLLSKNDLYKEEGEINGTLKNIIYNLSVVDNEIQDYRTLLMDKRIELKLDRVLNEKDAYNLIDETIDKLYQIPAKWEDENYITASQMLIENWGDNHKGLFEENYPRVFPNKEKVLMNVVWKKEKRELMMNVSTQLTEEQLKIIIENSTEIGELSSKVKKLQDENEILRSQLAAMGMISDHHPEECDAEDYNVDNLSDIIVPTEIECITESGKPYTITVAEPQYAGLSAEEMRAFLLQAKTDVKLYLEERGYRFSKGICENAWCNIYGVFDPCGKEVPIVVHSYRSRRRAFSLNTSDWEQLSKDGSMLWVVTHDGPQCVPFYALPRDTNTIAITFSPENMQYKSRCIALAETLKYFKGLHFNFGTSIGYNKNPEPFNNPTEELKLTMRGMHDLPAQSKTISKGAEEDSLF